MSNEALGHVWRYAPQKGPQFLVLIAIADIVNDANDNEIWFSLANLGKKCRLARSTVAEAIKELETDGWLIRVSSNPGETVRYQFQFVEGEAIWNSRNLSATRTPPVRRTDTTNPQGGHNTNINQIKTNGNNPDGLQIKELMKIYFENYTGDLEPARPQIAGQLQQALKQIPYEKLEPLVRQVAIDGQVVTRNTLVFAQNRLTAKPVQATPTPPKYDPTEFENPDAVPMPANFREMLRKAADATISPE
jgi:DNA-binding MarR family transcriptional regulator